MRRHVRLPALSPAYIQNSIALAVFKDVPSNTCKFDKVPGDTLVYALVGLDVGEVGTVERFEE